MILSFINQKGGAGKTTTALNVGAALTKKGYSVLLIDLDPQGNLTTAAGLQPQEVAEIATVYEVLRGDVNVNDAIRSTANGYDVLPTDIRQSGADIELSSAAGRQCERVGYSSGVYGINGGLLQDTETGEQFAIIARNSTLMRLF